MIEHSIPDTAYRALSREVLRDSHALFCRAVPQLGNPSLSGVGLSQVWGMAHLLVELSVVSVTLLL